MDPIDQNYFLNLLKQYGLDEKNTQKEKNGMNGWGKKFLEDIIKLGYDPNAKDQEGLTFLHYLMKRPSVNTMENIWAIQIFMSHGYNKDSRDPEGKTLLHYAMSARLPNAYQDPTLDVLPLPENIPYITCLLQYQFDLDAIDCYGHTPLYYAVQSGNASRVCTLLKFGAKCVPEQLISVCTVPMIMEMLKNPTYSHLIALRKEVPVEDPRFKGIKWVGGSKCE